MIKKVASVLALTLILASCADEKKEDSKSIHQDEIAESEADHIDPQEEEEDMKAEMVFPSGNLYDFEIEDINGESYDLSQHKGKKVLLVNTASQCGLTPQYEDLEALYKEKGGEEFVIIGFPANNFGEQEPGSNEEIAQFCEKNFGVSFPMMSKISVKGDDIHPLYNWIVLNERANSGDEEFEIAWNFHKILINEEGFFEKQINPSVLPNDESILSWIDSE